MTLHLAIEEVLSSAGHPLSPGAIADEVNRRGLYRRSDGTPIPSGQISARVRKYPSLFTMTTGGIWLTNRAVSAATEPVEVSQPVTGRSNRHANFVSTPRQPRNVEASLLESANFQRAGTIDAQVPDEFGIYAIRVRDYTALPEPFRTIASERGSRLIYLGEATGQTLAKRFLGNELRGRGHGTFFRSIGAVLGFRPAVGSLTGKGNQRNYRFLPRDSAAIVSWINENLEVSWVAFDEGIHAAEVALIRAHTPLLNLRDNPGALPELSALRALCCKIATTPMA